MPTRTEATLNRKRARDHVRTISKTPATPRRSSPRPNRVTARGGAISLRAVARELGMVSSAVYRYFPSRDDLLTELIIDAYADLAAVVDTADQQLPRSRYAHRWMRRCGAMRQWALGQPHRFHLLYGSPLPDYRAPTETVSPAVGVIAAFLAPLADAAVAGVLSPPPAPRRRGLRHQ